MGIDRRQFLVRGAAAASGLALGGPLRALAARAQTGGPTRSAGYGPLVDKGDLWLPADFSYTVVQRQGDPMSVNDPSTGSPLPTPSRFDGMATLPATDGTTIVIRNHENKRRHNPTTGALVAPANEVGVPVPADKLYDPATYNGGVVKVVVKDGVALDTYPLLGGTTHNCAGGMTPWGTWVTCEEFFQTNPISGVPHGYAFEVDVSGTAAVTPVPIVAAGRFEHEAVTWQGGALYETEDIADACFYRYTPASGSDLSSGVLEAMKLRDYPNLDTRLATSWPGGVGATHAVEWVPIANPDPTVNTGTASVRGQAQAQGAAKFARTEGCWSSLGKVYFDATTGGGTATSGSGLGYGQIFEYDPEAATVTLVFQAPKTNPVLVRPDNMALLETTGDLYLCEDTAGSVPEFPNHVRGLSRRGQVFDLVKAKTNATEFAGVCFDAQRSTMYVNQHGSTDGTLGVTYAITGPWIEARRPER